MISVVIRSVPAEDDAHHDRRRIERNARRHAALNQENDRGKRAGLGIEAPFQVFVSGVNAGFVEDGHGRGGEDHHRDRQPEVKLHEAHAVDISLAGGGDEGDGARLRRHDRKTHGVPRHGFAGQADNH